MALDQIRDAFENGRELEESNIDNLRQVQYELERQIAFIIKRMVELEDEADSKALLFWLAIPFGPAIVFHKKCKKAERYHELLLTL